MTYLPQASGGGTEPEPLPASPPAGEPILITSDMLAPPLRRPSGRVDFEQGMSYAPRLTLALIAFNIVVFSWEVATGALTNRASIIAAGALSRDEVLHGQVWRLVTPMFLHGSAEHLIGNLIALYILGPACEHALGTTRMAFLYLVSGLTGAFTSMALSEGPSVGASGAIFGVMAAVIMILYLHQDRFYLREKRVLLVIVLWALFIIATGLISPYVDNAAHAGGFLGGFLVARQMKPIIRAQDGPTITES